MSKRKPEAHADLLPPEEDPQSAISNPESDPSTELGAGKRSYERNQIVNEIPAACPRCGSVKSKVLCTTSFPKRPLRAGTSVYAGRITRRRICEDCKCRFISNAPSGKPRNSMG